MAYIYVKVKVKSLSRVQLFATPWTAAHQAPLSMGFSRQEYWSGLPFPSPGDLLDPGIEPMSPALQAHTGRHFNLWATRKPKFGGKVKLFLPIAHHKIPLSIESSWQEYHSGLPFPSPVDLPHPGIEPGSPALQVDSLPTEPPFDKESPTYQKNLKTIKNSTEQNCSYS